MKPSLIESLMALKSGVIILDRFYESIKESQPEEYKAWQKRKKEYKSINQYERA